ncbi:MAG: hypothetical protein LBG84_05460 [Treponema sp.]|nr:hypothetical protein [Treponema sp.]
MGKLENELRTNWEDGYYFDFRCYGGKSFKDLEAFKKWAPGFQKKFAGETGWDREIPAGHEMLLRFWSLCRGLLQNGFIVRGRAYHLICYDALYRSASFIFYFEPAKDFEGWVFTNTFTAFP